MTEIRLNPTILRTNEVQTDVGLHQKAKMSVLLMLKNQTSRIVVQTKKMEERQEEVKAMRNLLDGIRKIKEPFKYLYLDSLEYKKNEALKRGLLETGLMSDLKKNEEHSKQVKKAVAVLDEDWIQKLEKKILEHSKPMEEEQILLKEAISQYDKIDRIGTKILKMSSDLNLNIIKNMST